MTKRNLENILGETGDKVLRNLDHEKRYALLLKATKEDRDEWYDRLVETMPTVECVGPDPEHRRRAAALDSLAHTAVYDLHTLLLEYRLLETREISQQILEDHTPDDEPEQSPWAEADIDSGELLLDLYIIYHGYRRFARQVVGIDLETWLVVSYNGPDVATMVKENLELHTEYFEQINDDRSADERSVPSEESVSDEPKEETLDQLVQAKYEFLVDDFEDRLDTNTPKPGYLDL